MTHNYQVQKQSWIERNSLRANETHIRKLLERFTVNDMTYNLSFSDGEYVLFLTMGKRYMIQLDQQNRCYSLLAENLASNKAKKPKYHLVRKFNLDGVDALEEVLRYIKRRGKPSMKKKWKGVVD